MTVDALVIGTLQGADGLELAPGAEQVATAFDGDLTAVLAQTGGQWQVTIERNGQEVSANFRT